MIRLDYSIRKKPSLSTEQFLAYWRENHAPLWEKHANVLKVRRHIRWENHPDHPMAAPTREAYKIGGAPYDGMATTIWTDIRELEAALETPEGKRAYQEILTDEKNFIDQSASYLSFGIEHAVVFDREVLYATDDTDFVRGIYFPQGHEGFNIGEVQRHWVSIHGGLSHELTVGSSNRRYMQIHAGNFDLYHRFLADRAIDFDPKYFGHAEAFTSPKEADLAAKHNRPAEMFEYFVIDIDNFAECESSYFGYGKEYLVVDKPVYSLPLPKPIPSGNRLPYKAW